MNWSIGFFTTSALLGVGLAMDAFSMALANGLHEPCMSGRKMCGVAGVYAFFQALMPMLGWICVHTIVQMFGVFEKFVPWIAMVLLCYIGGGMLKEGLSKKEETEKNPCAKTVGFGMLLMQGVATSIDALSVGFTIAEYNWIMALIAALIIAVITFFICLAGLLIGRKFGMKFAGKASVFGGVVLILIGLEIFVTGII